MSYFDAKNSTQMARIRRISADQIRVNLRNQPNPRGVLSFTLYTVDVQRCSLLV
jgi:hypothetical protein